VGAGGVRPAWLVLVVALPFACSVYGPSDLQGWVPGQAGTGGDPGGRASATAGDAPDDPGMNGGEASHAAGTGSKGGSTGGGAAAAGAADEGGTVSETPSGGKSAGAGGANTGGANTGGANTGGANTGGANTGGANTGGANTGGANTGGANTGGANTGGANTGGANTGGAGGTSAISGLVASYPCESASGTVLTDSSGHGKNASLANGAGGGPAGFSFSSGVVGNALSLSSGNLAYVSLPRGIVSQLNEVTIATWVKLKSSAAFQRIFDFGVDTSTFMYLVNASSSGFVRFRIASAALNKNQVLEGAEALPVGKWTHVAVTVGDNGVFIFVNGVQIAQQAPAALRPSDLGDTGNDFIGRSPFAADPYLDGQIDEFRIFNRVLTSVEIAGLAKGQ